MKSKDEGPLPPRLGVAFSSGFFGFFAHAGFLAAIRESGIRPLAYAGASSGAIIAAMAASGMKDREIKKILFGLKKADFWDPDPWYSILPKALRLFKGYTGYLRGEGFARLLMKLPVRRIEDCAFPLAISATDITRKKGTAFTRGDLIKTIQASGSVPVLFKPVSIDGSLYSDGGVTGKAPVIALANLCELDGIIVHFIASGNLKDVPNHFLEKKFTPWHIQYLAVNIARNEAYKRDVEMVKTMGIRVLEVETAAPTLGPNMLHRGPEAYGKAKASALELLTLGLEK